MPPRLAVEGVGVAEVVGPVDFTVAAGACLGLSGPSGTGKTLLLRAIADLAPHEGVCRLDGTVSERIEPPEWRRRVAYVAAESAWWHERVGPHLPEVSRTRLDQLGLSPAVRDWPVARLSAGERQRLALLRSLAQQPAVLLLDEPTAHLDAANVARVEALIRDYRRERDAAAVWVTHDASQLDRVAERRLTLSAQGASACS